MERARAEPNELNCLQDSMGMKNYSSATHYSAIASHTPSEREVDPTNLLCIVYRYGSKYIT